ncbi:hypothetical protein PFISCL1PPCAC_3102, partial [Pristionchus fissidentatus]
GRPLSKSPDTLLNSLRMFEFGHLWLLLWKSWKTTIRSKGWSITQVCFTLLFWGLAFLLARVRNT